MTAVVPPGKWIDGLSAEAPVAQAARLVLKARLKGVEEMLPLAARKAGDDVEYVHQLRVVTRRSDAALRIFARCIDPARRRKARRRLRALRRAAAAARECDVHRAAIEADRAGAPEPVARVLDLVLAQVAEQRAEAQKAIRAACRRDAGARRLRRTRRRLIETVHPPRGAPGERLADAAAGSVPALVEGLHSAAGGDLTDVARLHALRIRGKRMRYALEVFAPCFAAGFREAYAGIEALQETLGAINDSNDLVERIEAWMSEASRADAAAGRAAVEHYRRRRERLVAAFVESWSAGGRARLFDALDRLVPAAVAAAGAEGPG